MAKEPKKRRTFLAGLKPETTTGAEKLTARIAEHFARKQRDEPLTRGNLRDELARANPPIDPKDIELAQIEQERQRLIREIAELRGE